MMPETENKPTIKIYCCDENAGNGLLYLIQGIEEEGIPWDLTAKPGPDAVALAFEACEASRLDVGLGLCGGQMVLHYNKLDPQKPLFSVARNAGEDPIRALGANAARLVKKIPFKPIDGR